MNGKLRFVRDFIQNVIVYVINHNYGVVDAKFDVVDAKLGVVLPKILRCYC